MCQIGQLANRQNFRQVLFLFLFNYHVPPTDSVLSLSAGYAFSYSQVKGTYITSSLTSTIEYGSSRLCMNSQHFLINIILLSKRGTLRMYLQFPANYPY